MKVIIGMKLPKKTVVEETIGEYQQMSFIIPSIESLKIKCSGERENVCKGKYFLIVSYKV